MRIANKFPLVEIMPGSSTSSSTSTSKEVMAPSLSEFKEHLDDGLSYSCGFVLGSPGRRRDLDSMILMGPFQLRIFCDSKCNEQDISQFR